MNGLVNYALVLIFLSTHITLYFEIKVLILEAFGVKRQGGWYTRGGYKGKYQNYEKVGFWALTII